MSQQAPSDWDSLRTKNKKELEELGLREWDSVNGQTLMLLPYTWHGNIPTGFEMESISGEKVTCKQGAKPGEEGYVDDDYRGGVLAYGFRVTTG